MSWLTWSTPTDAALRTKSKTTTLENVREHKACQRDHIEKKSSRDEQARREECRRVARVLQAQLDEDASRRPLVGLVHRNGWRDLNAGPRLIEYALERGKVRVSEFARKLSSRARSVVRARSVAVKNDFEPSMPGSSVLDLACIGGGEDFFSVPSDREDSYKFYMQVELDEETADSVKSQEKVDKPFKAQWDIISSQLHQLDQRLVDFHDSLKTGIGFFQEELLFEGLQGTPRLAADGVVEETFTSAVDRGIKLCSEALANFPLKVRLKKGVGSGNCRKKPLDFNLTLTGVKFAVSGQTGMGRSLTDVKLVVLREEFARKLFTSSSVISRAYNSQDGLSGKEHFLVGITSCY